MLSLREHLEDFAILRYVTKDLTPEEGPFVADHLAACSNCGSALASIKRLDVELRSIVAEGAMEDSTFTLAHSDPFYRRPETPSASTGLPDRTPLSVAAVSSAAHGATIAPQILDAARESTSITTFLASLDTRLGEHRFALLYALHEAGRTSAEDPFRAMSFAKSALDWIRPTVHGETDPAQESAEQMVPRTTLRAQAHLLLAIALLWTSRYSRAGAHLVVAYRGFAAGGGDETKLALVELAEAQRRALSHEPLTAIALAGRAKETFEDRGLDDYAARASVVEGMALYALGRDEEAILACRQALPTFEKHHLWSNYVGALNSVATCLSRLGRHEDARREYAKALRHFSHREHRYWLGYLRIGFAEALVAAGRFKDAASAAARAAKAFAECRLRAQTLIALLLEVESWARHGDLARAQQRLRLFWAQLERDGKSLDRVIIQDLGRALASPSPDFERLAALREVAANQIQEIYRAG